MRRRFEKRMETAGKFYTQDTFGAGVESCRELDEAFAEKRSWKIWKKISTLISFLVVATFIVIIGQESLELRGNLKSLLDPGLIGGSIVGFFLMRYLLIYALIWIPFAVVIGSMLLILQ